MIYNLRSRNSDSIMKNTSSTFCGDFFYKTLFKTSAITYALVLIFAILGGGSVIRLYGETCGVNIFDPSTWLRATMTIGSPWCKALNWVGYMSTSIVEHLWFHMFGLLSHLLSLMFQETSKVIVQEHTMINDEKRKTHEKKK